MFKSIRTGQESIARRILSLIISAVVHLIVIVVVVIMPLFFFNVLPESELLTFLIAPPPPPPALPPPPPPVQTGVAQIQKLTIKPGEFVEPRKIPKEIPPPIDEPPIVVFSGIIGGIPDGVSAGVLGGVQDRVFGGVISNVSPPPPPTPPKPVKRAPIRVGGNVQESKLIKKVEPAYPDLARRARVSAVVILQVWVDEEGNVADIKILRGHPLLNDEAVSAVSQWKYSPTLLNGEPVPVLATVTVNFKLR